MTAYCMKCKTQREVSEPKAVVLKNGRDAQSGACSVCGTKVMKMGKAQ